MRKVVVLLVVCVVAATVAFAQSTTDGAIGGTVFDKTGAVVGNAKITVHNNGTNAEQTVNADSSGYYRVSGLQPGSYTVTISGGGLAPYKGEQVIVQVGSLTEISPHLAVGGTQEVVEVTAEAPQINYTTPDFANTLDQNAVSNLPINGGRWSSFALLTPTVVANSSGFGLLSFRGISTLLNNNTVDGADNNQAFFSEERGRTRIGYSTPKAAVQEFQVNTSNYSAEYGRSAGGVVNTVSKSGTNDIHGEGYFYDRDNVWGAANAFTTINLPNGSGGFSPVNFKPTDWRKMAGFGVGGPLVKDKLFFFVAYDWFHRNFPGTAVASNPGGPGGFFTPPTATAISTLATRLGVTPAQASTIYQTDLNALNTMLGPVSRFGAQNIFFPKLDWAINSRNHASFSFNRMRWNSPAGIQTQATNTLAIRSFGDDFVKDTWGVAKLDTAITNNFANELRFQYGRDFEFEFSQQPTPYEVTNLLTAGAPASAGTGYVNPLGLPPQVSITNGFTFGVPTFLQRPAFPDEVRQQYADTMTWTHGKHTLKYGFDFSHVDDLSQNLRTQFGSYSYNSLIDYFSDLNKQKSCTPTSGPPTPIPCYSSNGYSQAFGPLGFEFTSNDYAIFAQDDWKILPRLSLSFGLRYEYEQLPKPFSNLINPLIPQTGRLPRDQNNFGPRAGFAWDITGSGKTVLRGGYGIYYGRIINSTIFNALTSTGMPGGQFSFSFSPTSAGAPVFPQILTASPAAGRSNVVFFDSHFQNPQIHQMDLTLERNIGWGTLVSVSYLGSLGRELPDFVDTNLCTTAIPTTVAGVTCPAPSTITYQVVNGGPLSGSTYTTLLFKKPSSAVPRPNNNFGSMTDIFSGVNSSYHALVVQVNHRMSHNIQFSANYTWSHAIDFGQNEQTFTGTNFLLFPTSIAAEKGNSQYDVPNRLVVNAVVTSPWSRKGWLGWFTNGWEFSPIYQIQNGLPYTLSVSGTAPNAEVSGVNGSGGTNRIDVLGNNSFRQPLTWIADMRLAKHFKFQERYDLELIADFFNIANKQNVTSVNNTGYFVFTGSATPPPGTASCSTANPCLDFFSPFTGATSSLFGTTTNSNSNFAYTPRQIQLGARFRF
jgi:hypothetical protein